MLGEYKSHRVLMPDLRVVFCGIHPGKSSAHTGFHFVHPGERFRKANLQSGFVDRLPRPDEEHHLLDARCGMTMLVEQANDTGLHELQVGGRGLIKKAGSYQPAALCRFLVNGMIADNGGVKYPAIHNHHE